MATSNLVIHLSRCYGRIFLYLIIFKNQVILVKEITFHNVCEPHPISWRSYMQRLRYSREGILPPNCSNTILPEFSSSQHYRLLPESPACQFALQISDLWAPIITWTNSLKSLYFSFSLENTDWYIITTNISQTMRNKM